jgi:hypothetical protein
MSTFLYAPGVQIFVATARNGIVDVSDDISSGTVSLRENQPHAINFSLANHRRKYDGVFTPNDRFTVRLKRVKWLQIMSGYLTQVPFFTTYPRSVALSGECTLKRLRFRLWDPGYEASILFVDQYTVTDDLEGVDLDDSFTRKAKAVLQEVAQWPSESIHIGRIPSEWLNRVDTIARDLADEFSVAAELIGSGSTMNGVDPLEQSGTKTITKQTGATTFVTDAGPGYGHLPYLQGAIQVAGSRSGTALLTGESLARPNDTWWCDIRLPFAPATGAAATLTSEQRATAKAWWRNRHLIVVNPKTNASIVLRVFHDGPPATSGRHLVVSPAAAEALGLGDGGGVSLRFAKPEARLGTDGVVVGDTPTTGSTTQTTQARPSMVQSVWQPGQTVQNSSGGAAMGSKVGLKPNVATAFDFGAQNFPGVKSIGGVGQRGNASDHPAGLALDFMMTTASRAQGEEVANGNAVAAWFAANPNAFGTKYIIWMDRSNSGTGWKPYVHPNLKGQSASQIASAANDNLQHRNHVHVSFNNTGAAAIGPMGSAWPGSAPGDFTGGFTNIAAGGTSPLGADYWFGGAADPESTTLAGIRALMNDQPLLPYITMLMQASMRSYCAAPNGDFIGWFPDYFGVYGTAGRMMVRNIELTDFSVTWSDENLKTHVFTSASITGFGSPGMETQVAANKAQTSGIATVEFPGILRALLNVDPNDPASDGWLNPQAILQRFGARKMYEGMGALTSRKAEFWYALQLFQENWAKQFSCQAPITFMPELFPGMLLMLADYGVQFYVTGVDHTFDFEGGGFRTTAYIAAPSSTDGRGLFGLPKGGRI